jgi:hypothetical protein
VATEQAAIGVQLVEHEVAQARQHAPPGVVMRQDAAMQHVGVGGDRMRPCPRGTALGRRRVAVVGGHTDPGRGRGVDPGQQARELPHRFHLIASERLGGEQQQRSRPGISQHRLHERHLEAERLARRSGGGEHHVAPFVEGRDRCGLVLVRRGDPPLAQRRKQSRIKMIRPRAKGTGSCKLLVSAHEIHRGMASDLLGRRAQRARRPPGVERSDRARIARRGRLQWRAHDPFDDMGFSRAGQGLMISTVTVASP